MTLQDFGGAIAIHTFGAYFGLAASWVLFARRKGAGSDHPRNGPSYLSDLTSVLGTLFLWLFWPSFNAAVATVGGGGEASEGLAALATESLRTSAVLNTVLSLAGSCLATFALSGLLKGRLDMMAVQNATLAGGVAMGSAATMVVGSEVVDIAPGVALGVGAAAGTHACIEACAMRICGMCAAVCCCTWVASHVTMACALRAACL